MHARLCVVDIIIVKKTNLQSAIIPKYLSSECICLASYFPSTNANSMEILLKKLKTTHQEPESGKAPLQVDLDIVL